MWYNLCLKRLTGHSEKKYLIAIQSAKHAVKTDPSNLIEAVKKSKIMFGHVA